MKMANDNNKDSRRRRSRGVLRATWRGITSVLSFLCCVPCLGQKKGKCRKSRVSQQTDLPAVLGVVEAPAVLTPEVAKVPVMKVIERKAEWKEEEDKDLIRKLLGSIVEEACRIEEKRQADVTNFIGDMAKDLVENAIQGAIAIVEKEKIAIQGPIARAEKENIAIQGPIVMAEKEKIAIQGPIAMVEKEKIAIQGPIATVERELEIAIQGPIAMVEKEEIESVSSSSGDVFEIAMKNSDNGEKFMEDLNILLLYEWAKFNATKDLIQERGEWSLPQQTY